MSSGETLTHRRPSRDVSAGGHDDDIATPQLLRTDAHRHTRHWTSSTSDSKTSGKAYPEGDAVLMDTPRLNDSSDTGVRDGPIPYTEAEDKRIARKIDWVNFVSSQSWAIAYLLTDPYRYSCRYS